jgi:hypothetical protein
MFGLESRGSLTVTGFCEDGNELDGSPQKTGYILFIYGTLKAVWILYVSFPDFNFFPNLGTVVLLLTLPAHKLF